MSGVGKRAPTEVVSRLIHADCILALSEMPTASVDAVVTDPPYLIGFMGKVWDTADGIAGKPIVWRECLRVLKPGGHLLAFGGTRTYHRMTCAIEDAGFEVRDSLHWVYGSGMPKSHNLQGEWKGWGTALKPTHEPIVVARKPLARTVAANAKRYGTGALNIDGCRVESDGSHIVKGVVTKRTAVRGDTRSATAAGMYGAGASFVPTNHPGGRWPPNMLLTHAPECDEACAADCPIAEMDRQREGASQFFPVFRYQAKASRAERGENNSHPTPKPVDLMQWLVRLVTPPGGTVLDPFMGSGTTGIASVLEGFSFVGIERDAEYCSIARARIARASGPSFHVADEASP